MNSPRHATYTKRHYWFGVLPFRRPLFGGKSLVRWSNSQPHRMVFLQHPGHPASYSICPRAGHKPWNQSQGAGFELKWRRKVGAKEVGYLEFAEDGRDPHDGKNTANTWVWRPEQGKRLWPQSWVWSSLVMELEHKQPENLSGWWWLMALNIVTLCFTFTLSRYGAEESTGLPSGHRTQVVCWGGRSLRLAMMVVISHLKSCHREGPIKH